MSFFHPFGLFNQLKQALFAQSVRGHKMKVLHSWKGGIKYPGFTYFPRPGQVDPPYEATKLFLVQRTKPFKGNNIKLKRILTSIGLGEKITTGSYTIVKNTTDMNAQLWKIKHLIRIAPVTTPDGLPDDGNFSSCHLDYETGIFRVRPELKYDEKRLALANEYSNHPKRIRIDIWKKDARARWLAKWW